MKAMGLMLENLGRHLARTSGQNPSGGPRQREVVVHIGLEKTGTTSIQQTLKANSASLAKIGTHFDCHFASNAPGSSGNSVGLVLAAQTQKRRRWRTNSQWNVRDSFKDYVYDGLASYNEVTKIVFSAEHLSSQLTETDEIERLAAFLRGLSEKVTIIAYVRRPDQFVHSLTNEYIKAGGTFTLSRQGDILEKIVAGGKINFARVLLRYIEVFGRENVRIRRFDRKLLRNGDVVDDFFAALDISEALTKRPKTANSSHSREALYLHSVLTDIGRNAGYPPEIREAQRMLLKVGKGSANFLIRAEAEKLMERMDPETRALENVLGFALYDRDFSQLPDKREPVQTEELHRLAQIPEVKSALKKYLLGEAFPVSQ